MNVLQLIEQLQDMPEDAEVRIAGQPSYPMQYFVDAAVEVHFDSDADEGEEEAATIVYIVEGGQPYDSPYLPGAASDEIGW